MSKKLLACILAVSIACLCFAYAYWEFLAGHAVRFCVNAYCKHHFSNELQVGNVYKHEDYWALEKPVLSHEGSLLTAERLLINIGAKPLDRTIELELIVENSHIDLQEEITNLQEVIHDIISKTLPYWLFEVRSRLIIEKGKVSWKKKETGETQTADFFFEAKSNAEKTEGHCSLFLNGRESLSDCFELKIKKENNNLLMAHLTFSKVECGKIAHIYQALGHPLHGWEIKEGVLDGNIYYLQPQNKRAYTWGHARLNNLKYGNAELEIAGWISEAAFELDAEFGKKEVPSITGQIRVNKEAWLELAQEDKPYWALKDFMGEVAFRPKEGINIAFGGKFQYEGHEFGLSIKGDAGVFNENQSDIQLFCRLSNPDKEDAEARILVHQFDTFCNSAQIEVSNVGKEEFNLVKTALIPHFKDAALFHMLDGRLKAAGIAYFEDYRLADLKIDQIAADRLLFTYDAFDLSLNIDKVQGIFSINMAELEPLETLDADFSLHQGNLSFQGLNGKICHFNEVVTDLAFRKGLLQKSLLKGRFEGLEGELTVDWKSPQDFIKMNFNGPIRNISSFFPSPLGESIDRAFSKDIITITGGMSWQGAGSRFAGEIQFGSDAIAFGFDLEKCSKQLWTSWPADELAISFWKNAGGEAMQKVIPPIASPLAFLESNWIVGECGIGSFIVRKGWFKANQVALEKYAAPFLFSDNQIHIRGLANFNGFFDHKGLAVEYDVDNFLLENQYLAIKGSIQSSENADDSLQLGARHYFNFDKGSHFGSLPLSGATYLEKCGGLIFRDFSSLVILEGNKVHFSDISVNCLNVALEGMIDLAFQEADKDKFTLEIQIDSLKGTLPQVKSILAHYKPDLPLLDFQIEGNVSLSRDGARLIFAFEPNDYQFDAKIKGQLSNGKSGFLNSFITIDNGKLNFDYDHQHKTFLISNIYGNVSLGDERRSEQYILSGEYLRFIDYSRELFEFDIWLGDQNRDLIRVAGKTIPENHSDNASLVSFHLDPELTHFGDIHPSDFLLIIRNWTSVENFRLVLDISLNTLLHDLQRFRKSSLFLASKGMWKGLNQIKNASGKVRVDIGYDGKMEESSYQINGSNLALNDYALNSCLVSGTKNPQGWFLKTLKLDDLVLSAMIKNAGNLWQFDQLECFYGDAIAMKLKGAYDPEESKMKAQIAAFKMDFNKLKKTVPLLNTFVETCSPHGRMLATGEIEMDFSGNNPLSKIQAILNAAFESWDMKGLHFQDVQNISCHFVSDKGITLRNFSTDLLNPATHSARAHLFFEKAYFEFPNGEIAFEGLNFQVPAYHLPWFTETVSKSFPSLFTPVAADAIRNSKLEGMLEGTLQYEFTPPYTAMQLKLKDGKYFFMNSEHQLSHFVMEYDPFEFKVASKYHFGNESFWLYSRSTSPNLLYGDLVLTELPPHQQAVGSYDQALFIYWENDPAQGFSIKHAIGNLYGLNMKLQRDSTISSTEKMIYLEGTLSIDPRQAKPLFPEEFAQKIDEWKLGEGYTLKGKWRYQKEGSSAYANVYFNGMLEGNNFAVKGYQFDAMTAHLEYNPTSIHLRNLAVVDEAGELSCGSIDLIKGQDASWYFSMPLLTIQKLKPSILRQHGFQRPILRKPLNVRELILEGCYGCLSNSDSIAGKGNLKFTNRSKRRLQNTIFHIPADILSRIGLDLSVLTPVVGTIEYKLHHGRVYLTKLKDVYSESKLSRFYLSPKFQSTMDFDGNLNVQIRMKQHNLLFKLAELFNVNIGGTLEKPVYSLNKQRN